MGELYATRNGLTDLRLGVRQCCQ